MGSKLDGDLHLLLEGPTYYPELSLGFFKGSRDISDKVGASDGIASNCFQGERTLLLLSID